MPAPSGGGLIAEFGIDDVKTKSVERSLAPLVEQVTTLAAADQNGQLPYAMPQKPDVLIKSLERSIENFVERGSSVVNDAPQAGDAKEKLVAALEEVKRTGATMISSGGEFVKDACSSKKRAAMIASARALLTAVARMLIIADMIDVRLLLDAVKRVKGGLDDVKGAGNHQELTDRYGQMRLEMDALTEETRMRLNDLRNRDEVDDLRAARALLKTNTPIMYTASKAFVRHPEIDPARMNRDFAHSEMSKALQNMDDVLQGNPRRADAAMAHYGKVGDLINDLDKFQNRVYLDGEPHTYRKQKHRPELEEMLERIVSGAALVADSESTRDDRKQRIVQECNALRQALQDLLGEYERNAGRKEPTEELDLALVHLGHKTKDLRRHLRRAIVDHVSDAFLDTRVPLLVLIDAAERQDRDGVEEAGRMFVEHAGKLVEVANMVCQMSNNAEGVKMIRYAASQVERLAPQVVNAARLLCARPDSKVAQENMAAFRDAWEEKVRLLTLAVDSIITVDDFLAVSEAHIVEDVKACIEAVCQKDGDTLDRTAGAIRGRSLRVCDVVDNEMDMLHPSPYTDKVRHAVKVLRQDVLPSFASHAGGAVGALNADPQQPVDVDEFIDAASVVHDAIRDIRHALLLNRCPEDVDSDNEYVDEPTEAASRQSDGAQTDQQKIMRNLPPEEKQKIQEQVDIFKIVQTKFEREVAKWDETGNDIIVLAKHMCMIMMNMTDFTRGRGPLKTTMDVIQAAQQISNAGAKLNALAKQIGDEAVESETKKDLVAYLQRITLYCQQLNITSRVKADVQQVGDELVVSGLESAMSLIQTARNLLNAVVLTVKSAYIASTKYRRKNTTTPKLVEWQLAPPQKQPLVRPQTQQGRGIVRRASDKRPMPPIKALAEFNVAS